jgi:methyltransferase family protein
MKMRELAIACRNLIYGGNLASVSMLRHPRSAVNYMTECLFLKGCLDDASGMFEQRHVWQSFELAEPVAITIDGPAATEWFRHIASYTADLVSVCMLCRILNPKVVFEIGTYHGSGTLHLACNSPQATVYTLDLAPNSAVALDTTSMDWLHIHEHAKTPRMFFEGRPEQSRIVQLYGDSSKFDYTAWLHKVDLFFIDGSHSYQYVRNDTMKALQCCHPGSVIAWHDYGRFGINGVSRWLHEFAAQGHKIERVPGGSLAYMKVQAADLAQLSVAERSAQENASVAVR